MEKMYEALGPEIMQVMRGHPKWTPWMLKQRFEALYECYVKMNTDEPYAFESQAANKVAGGMTPKRGIFVLMKRYLIERQADMSAL